MTNDKWLMTPYTGTIPFIQNRKPGPQGQVRYSWQYLKLETVERAAPFGVGCSLFGISNIECRTRNFEQQKFLKEMR